MCDVKTLFFDNVHLELARAAQKLSVPISILGWICTSIGLLQTSLGGSHAPVMLVGNKSDRVTEREVSTQVGSALAKEMGCDFVEASAKQCINVEKAF